MPRTIKVQDLTIEQAGLLWCMRAWVAGRLAQRPASGRIEHMAAQLDTPEAGRFIEGFMESVNRGATRTLDVGCIGCPTLAPDEALLLHAVALTQERRLFEALLALQGLVIPAMARAAIHNAECAGLALARRGRFLPTPDPLPCDDWFADWQARPRVPPAA